MHADHLSGSVRVARKYGSEVAISEFENYATEQVSSEQDPKCNLISTGQKFELGDGFYLEAIHTPGHTDGSMSFLLKIHNVTKNDYTNNSKVVAKLLPKIVTMMDQIIIFLQAIPFL